jgi:hypothetical protein
MKLLDDIIDMAADDKEPVGNLLRKCLILENQIKNEKFRAWLNQELDGYDGDRDEALPDYRVFNCVNKGDFLGMTLQLPDQPISLHIMDEHDQKRLQTVHLRQSAASYEGRPNKDRDGRIPWHPTTTVKYQKKIYQGGDPALIRAWQEIPGSILVGLLEQVRTRVLRFALDLKDNLPKDSVDATTVPADVVEKSVVNNIFGGKAIDWT